MNEIVGARTEDDVFSTATHEFVSRDTSSSIALVGVSHFATSAYFKKISAYIQHREDEGSVVHYEDLSSPEEATLCNFQTWIQRLCGEYDSLARRNIVETLFYDPTVTGQENGPGIHYRERWQAHDASTADLFKEMGRLQSTWLVRYKLYELDERSRPNSVRRAAIRVGQVATGKIREEFIINWRNQIALRAVENTIIDNPNQNITLLWGYSHTIGLAKGVTGLGYHHQPDRTSWNAVDRS